MEYQEERETLNKWAANKGQEGLEEYRSLKNAQSIDGMAAFSLEQG